MNVISKVGMYNRVYNDCTYTPAGSERARVRERERGRDRGRGSRRESESKNICEITGMLACAYMHTYTHVCTIDTHTPMTIICVHICMYAICSICIHIYTDNTDKHTCRYTYAYAYAYICKRKRIRIHKHMTCDAYTYTNT